MRLKEMLPSFIFRNELNKIPKDFITRTRIRYEFTKDMPELQKKTNHYVFVSGSEMTRHKMKEQLFPNKDPVCVAFTYENFGMWRQNNGWDSRALVFDGRLDCERNPWFKTRYEAPWAKIKGEVYEVRPHEFFELDRYHKNGVYSRRRLTQVIIPYWRLRIGANPRYDGQYMEYDIKAWMYTNNETQWADQIDFGLREKTPSFSPGRIFTVPRVKRQYMYFTLVGVKHK